MAVIHHTTLSPSKIELIAAWLPTRPWYRAGGGAPQPVKAGGFRLDDPDGEVGMEFMVVTDAAGPESTAYLVPLTYRGAPLEGAEHALVGTMEHGVLGRRWAYDGCHDPVLIAQLFALVEGRAVAQDQNATDTPDPQVTCTFTGAASLGGPADRVRPADASVATATATAAVADDSDGTELRTPYGVTLRLNRVLQPIRDATEHTAEVAAGQAPDQAPDQADALGHVAGWWQQPDGTRVRGPFAVLRAE
ncbi:maltokinase N-terminal cap-like domain-containing protein [Kitasatospora sp. NPDC054939]